VSCFRCGTEDCLFCIAEDGTWEPGDYLAGLCAECAKEICPAVLAKYEARLAEDRARWARNTEIWNAQRDRMQQPSQPRRNLKDAVKRLIKLDDEAH